MGSQCDNQFFFYCEKHFRAVKTKWCITKFIDLETLSNTLNEYLINDVCVCGCVCEEVFVVKNTFKGERSSMMHEPPHLLPYLESCAQLMSLAKLKDPKEGYMMRDICIIKAEFTLLGVVLAKT
ncbi:hypothetical protein CUMW_194670 [Citrus unshiu]|nr:hypothetical protein CUMW_194670 [Citrus unshiu]